jgi:hypothetical protein
MKENDPRWAKALNEVELSEQAEILRRRLLDIWGGDAKRADEYLCWLMRYMKDVHPKLPANQQDPENLERALRLMAMLIQR